MEPLRCHSCSQPISDKWEAFKFLQDLLVRGEEDKKKFQCHVDRRPIDPSQNTNLIPIFEALHIEKYCCRKIFTSARIMSELRA